MNPAKKGEEKIFTDFDWLESKINDKEHEQVFIGYTSFTNKRVTTTNQGVWLGYDKGELFFQMRFRYHLPKVKFGKDVWTHIKAISVLFDSVGRYIRPYTPPKIIISSIKAQKFIENNVYKNLSVYENIQDKQRFISYMDIFTPQFDYFQAVTPPYSLLRELVREDNKNVAKKVVDKSFYDYSSWND